MHDSPPHSCTIIDPPHPNVEIWLLPKPPPFRLSGHIRRLAGLGALAAQTERRALPSPLLPRNFSSCCGSRSRTCSCLAISQRFPRVISTEMRFCCSDDIGMNVTLVIMVISTDYSVSWSLQITGGRLRATGGCDDAAGRR